MLIFTFLTRLVNDEANKIMTEVFQWRDEVTAMLRSGSETQDRKIEVLESQVLKQQILLEGTNYVRMNSLDGSGGGIQFRVVFVRWTTSRFVRLVVLFIGSQATALLSRSFSGSYPAK